MKNRKGVTLLDALMALTVSAFMFAEIAQLQNHMTQNLNAEAAANRMSAFEDAARVYITQNYQQLVTMASSTPIEIPISGNPTWNGIGDLHSAGGLPASFTAAMPLNQTVHLLVRQINANGNVPQHLEALLVTSGGNPMNDGMVGLSMAKMGGDGGGIMKTVLPGKNNQTIYGSFGSWSESIANWQTGSVPITAGHIAMDLSSVGSSLSDWLNRYNTGNPEANRMHTNIDMNNFSLNNTNSINSNGTNDLNLDNNAAGGGLGTGRVVMGNGGMACNQSATGCHFDISDDGGMYDYNNGWITYQSSYNGFKIANQDGNHNGTNLEVTGGTYAAGGVTVADGNGVKWTGSGLAPVDGGSNTADASASYAGGWLNFGGANGFQGISTNLIVRASRFSDYNNANYYVIPSGVSRMNYADFANNIGTNGLDAQSGFPNGWTGIHTWDVYAEGGIGVGSGGNLSMSADNSNLTTYNGSNATTQINYANGSVRSYKDGCNFIVGTGNGCIYGDYNNLALRVPGTNGINGGKIYNEDQNGNPVNVYAGAFSTIDTNKNVKAYMDSKGNVVAINSGNKSNDSATVNNFTNGTGNIVSNGGYITATNGEVQAFDGGAGNGIGVFENFLLVGQNSQGGVTHLGNPNNGGLLIVRGNENVSGVLKFNYGVDGDNGQAGGYASPGSTCALSANGPGQGAVGMNVSKNALAFCGSDLIWHAVKTVDGYGN